MRLLAVLLLVTACGGSSKSPASTMPTGGADGPPADPIPRTAGPDCGVVAEKLSIVLEEKADAQATAREKITVRCTSAKWSDEARSCFASVENEAELDGCKGTLTEAQRAGMTDGDTVSGDSMPAKPATKAPPPPPPGKTVPKADSAKSGTRSADPCEGGE